MRRIRLTAFLLGTAALAAAVAPRLLVRIDQPAVVEAIEPVTVVPVRLPPPVAIAPPPPPEPPARPAPPKRPIRNLAIPKPVDRGMLIPELDEPPLPPPEVPDTFWDDCPACGMG